jgi:hypothetical protein
MVLDEKITTTISYLSIEYYKSIGYVDIKCNQKIEIPIGDLPIESNLKVNVKCDVCGNEKLLAYQKYNKNIRKYNIYTCNNSCAQFKNKLTLKELYGSENFNRTEENKLKTKEKYDKITKEIEKIGYIKCSKCAINNELSYYLKNKNDRYKRVCRECRNYIFNINRNKNPHIKAWRSVLKSFLSRTNTKKSDRSHILLGYSPDELKNSIENKFKDGMCWENYGEWHIDHIVHVSLFRKDSPCYIVNCLDNLRPLDSKLNIARRNNLDDDCLNSLNKFRTYIREEFKNF